MPMPVVVSRIQNRRGTQAQFLANYPPGYNGIGGYSTPQPPTPTTFASGTGTIATLNFAPSVIANYQVGSIIVVSGVVPTAYNGSVTVTASTPSSVQYASTAVGLQTVSGNIVKPYNSTNYDNILQPGEIGLCTDTRRIFLGNLNGEYIEVNAVTTGEGLIFPPSVWVLPPSPVFVPITTVAPGPILVKLDYDATPFFTVLYDITDSLQPDWNTVGTSFSQNGQLQITAIDPSTVLPPTPPPPPVLPPVTNVTLSDTSTGINLLQPSEIHFKAQYAGTKIEIMYMHDFPGSLTFSTGAIRWLPF